MLDKILQVALKAAFPNGLKVKFDQQGGQVSILTGTDQVIKQLTFLEAEQLINTHLQGTSQ